jgi:hypothetical protein
MMLAFVLAGLLAFGGVIAGTGQTPMATAAGVLDCRDPIGSESKPPANSAAVGDAVALLTGFPDARAMTTARVSEPLLPSLHHWTKSPLYVRSDRAAEIRIPYEERGRIAMTWGNTASDPVVERSLSVGPCPGTIGWSVFPGGYFVTRPDCYTLIVRVKGRNTRVSVGIGAPCPGQRPPPALQRGISGYDKRTPSSRPARTTASATAITTHPAARRDGEAERSDARPVEASILSYVNGPVCIGVGPAPGSGT